ncbi:hypothetical protein BAE44_0018007 [Dichanthelium oligosanthes]|uniref:DUF632 domain-containing protein n=1 Tax=Dichanthelium oligosanthes TaxID=888268 RepID=A0A1E5V7G5_9POAL|nr:hypothetical protein BAE44_0018007 [Dichanthelium oligosanthes]
MGCRSSRLEAADVSPAAALCRERRDLLRAAADRRAHLAAAHAAYFSALPRVADALARFASHHHAATPPGSPVLTLPPPSDHGGGGGDGDDDQPKKQRSGSASGSATPHTDSGHSHIHFHSGDDAYDSDPGSSSPDPCAAPGGCGGGHGHGHGEIPRPAPVLRSGVPLPDHGYREPQERQIHPPGPPVQEMPWEYASYNPYPSFPDTAFQSGTYPSFPSTAFQNGTFPSYHYMKASSTPANTVYQEPYGYGNFTTSSSYMGYDYGYNNPMYGVPLPPEGDRPVEDRRREPEPPAPPPPMPVPETSPWDFFNPFDSYEQELPQYKAKGYNDSNGSFTSSPNSSEVRAREGIPELEEETEMESMRESVKARKAVESTASNRIDNVDVSAKVKVSMEHKEGEIESVDSASVLESGQESVCSCDCDHTNARTGGPVPLGDDQGKVKNVSSEDHSSMVVVEDVRPPENIGTRDVSEVVEEIKEQFNSVAACGDDVARILEVGRMRLVRMWKFILECHRKQFHTILETKSHILIPKNGPERSSSKVTLELEMELLNWCSCFRNWILSQKAYIETLNGWLVKWLPQEKEETPDGIAPFSPGRLGAPAVFITANDWCQAMKRIPEGSVVDTMEAFAVNVHVLWERQDEEQQQKLKADYLSRDFAKRLKSLQKEHGLQGYFGADKTVLPIAANNGRAVDNRMVALDTLHKRLDEQKARHEETVKQMREASATDLKAGLAPIFEALESFTQETLRGYENVRITVGSGGA